MGRQPEGAPDGLERLGVFEFLHEGRRLLDFPLRHVLALLVVDDPALFELDKPLSPHLSHYIVFLYTLIFILELCVLTTRPFQFRYQDSVLLLV
jgi:hypothetical protein